MPWVYILRCNDDSLYVGIATELRTRIKQHQDGVGGSYTAKRRPVSLAYSEAFDSMPDAMMRERQIKRWSAQKKAALISGDFERLHSLAKRRRPKR